MYNSRQQQHYIDLHDADASRPFSDNAAAAAGPATGNVDRGLYNDLVEIVPLIQSLIDHKGSSSFTRRGSIAYTKAPSRDSLSRKQLDSRSRNGIKPANGRKRGDQIDKDLSKNSNLTADGSADANSNSASPATVAAEKDREELTALSKQVENLQQKLLEKDELLKESENDKNQMSLMQAKLVELKRLTAEKNISIKSAQHQLSDAKIKLADKQAALEKIQWEAMMSNQKCDQLQEEITSMESHISSYTMLLEGLSKDNLAPTAEEHGFAPYDMEPAPYIDDMDEIEMQKIEAAREAYVAALAVAKEKCDEESLAAATSLRLHLQSLVFGINDDNVEESFEVDATLTS
ncbi:MICROTUBULE BINDING PROTEIN 2C-like protein [Drosera capensis]